MKRNYEIENQIESIAGIEKVKDAEVFRGDEFTIDLNPKQVLKAKYVEISFDKRPNDYPRWKYWRPKTQLLLHLKTKIAEYLLDEPTQSQLFTRIVGLNSRDTPKLIKKGEINDEYLTMKIREANPRDGFRFYYTKKITDGSFAGEDGDIDVRAVHSCVGNQHIRIPHINALSTVVEELNKEGIQIEGGVEVSRHKSTVKMKLMFDNKKKVEKVGDVVQVGMELTNDKEGRCSLWAKPFVLRLACLNGMVRSTAGDNERVGIHIGEYNHLLNDLRKQVRTYLKDIFAIEVEITRANKIKLDEDTMMQVAERLFKRKHLDAHKLRVIRIIKRGEHGAEMKTAWGLVNAVTGYATHGGVSELQKETINKIANEILDCKNKDEILALATEPEVKAS